MSSEHDSLHHRGRLLEEAFFFERDQQLLEGMRRKLAADEAQALLEAATGVQEQIVIKEIADASAPQFLAILGLFPLVEVAWCDGQVEDAERQAVLKAAHEMGVVEGTVAHQLLDRWLEQPPTEDAKRLWADYASAICATLKPETSAKVQEAVLGRAKKVALAAGGFLGIGYKISAEESACLERLRQAFGKACH